MSAALVLIVVTTFAVNPEAIHSEFRPINPIDHFQAWSISITALLLGAFQEEIWNRAILQSTLTRMLGNRWVGLAITVILLTLEQPGHRVENFCVAIFLGVLFIRTQSVVSTTMLHIVLNLSMGILQGGTFMVASFLSPLEVRGVKLTVLLGLLLLAFAVELWYRRSPRLLQLTKAFAKNLLLVAFAITLCSLTGKLLRPLWTALIDYNPWLNGPLLWRSNLLAEAAVTVVVLACLRWGPSLRELLAIRARATLSLALVAALVPASAAALVLPKEFSSGSLEPLSPFTTSPYFWLGTVLPLLVSAIGEELFHRALIQSLLSRLLRSEWAGAIGGALWFAGVHPLESAMFVLPGALLFAVVFMRTRSIVCTTVLHLTLNVSGQMIAGTHFTHSLFLSPDDFVAARPLYGALLLAFSVGFEWCWRMSAEGRARRLGSPPKERTASGFAASTSA